MKKALVLLFLLFAAPAFGQDTYQHFSIPINAVTCPGGTCFLPSATGIRSLNWTFCSISYDYTSGTCTGVFEVQASDNAFITAPSTTATGATDTWAIITYPFDRFRLNITVNASCIANVAVVCTH